jgi:hypothetical protein
MRYRNGIVALTWRRPYDRGRHSRFQKQEETMVTIDDFFLAHGISFSGFNTFLTRNGNPSFTVGVAGFGNRNGVYGQTEVIDVPRFVAGVYGTAATQPGVIGFSREGDGAQGASFAGTAFRAVSFFGPGVHSTSGALSGVTGISTADGPPAGMNIPTTAGVVGTSASRPGVIGTSNALMGVYGFSSANAGIVGETANPNSFAGFFAGNAVVTGTLTAGVKNSMVAFPDGSQRVLHCMESPEQRAERGRAARIRRPAGEGSAGAGSQGRKASATALSRAVEAGSCHCRRTDALDRARSIDIQNPIARRLLKQKSPPLRFELAPTRGCALRSAGERVRLERIRPLT